MEALLQSLLQSTTETEVLEFKEAKNQYDKDKLGKYFSAMSNEANLKGKTSAWLLFGVNNNKQIVGTAISDAQVNDYKSEMASHSSPTLSFTEVHRLVVEDKTVLMLQIPSAPQGMPVAWKGLYYGRDGESLGGLNINELERIRNQGRAFDWSAQIIERATLLDIDPLAINVAREKFKERSSRTSFYNDIDNWDNTTFLDKAKITINGKITNTALILLGKDESSHYLLPAISEITWKLETEEKAYEHFGMPMLLNTTKILQNIRNVKYKFFPDNELLATTVNKYDTRTILEAMNNCIAHQDYMLNSRIIVTEKIDKLIFSNAGSFYEGIPDDYTQGDRTPHTYRNPWLANAMVNLGMIDRLGYGIHSMYLSQRSRYFPLPDYLLSDAQKVILQIYGHSIDENYSKLLIEHKDLPLTQVILLDRVQKKKSITDDAANLLKKEKLIEGRKPNYFVTASVAAATDGKVNYIKNKAFDKEYYKKLIVEFILKYGKATRAEIDELLTDKLSSVLTDEQKRTKIRNLLYEMSKKDKTILNQSKATNNPVWVLRA